MKVLFLSVDRGGPGLSAYEHRLGMLRSGLQNQGICTAILNLRHPIERPLLALPLNLPTIRKELEDADFLHCGGSASYVAAFLRPFVRARVVADVHGDALSEARLKWQYRHDAVAAGWVFQAKVMDSLSYQKSSLFLVVSKPQASQLVEKQHIPPARIALVRNGVDVGVFQPSAIDRTKREFVVCYAGGFQPWQGLAELIDAMEKTKSPNLRLRIIGFTKREHSFRQQVAARLGSRAELIDRMPQQELATQLLSADILIIPRPRHPAVEVALPTKFAEYAALGKAIMVCEVDETAQLVRDNQCGLVSAPTARDLANTLEAAAGLGPDELKRMGKKARALAEREFAWEVIGRNYGAFLATWHSHGASA